MDTNPVADTTDDSPDGFGDIDWLEREFIQLFPEHRTLLESGRTGVSEHARVLAWRTAVHKLASMPQRRSGNTGPTALCLSGGGIRSATFGLGVLQGLAVSGWLKRFDYLSTVSGGGYIGCWLAAWMQRESCGAMAATQARAHAPQPDAARGIVRVERALAASATAKAPGGSATAGLLAPADGGSDGDCPPPVDAEPEAVRRLRSYSNFLSPAVGLTGDMMALVAIYLRNLVVRWLVLVPLLCALLLLPRLVLAGLDWFQPHAATPVFGLVDRDGVGLPWAAVLFGTAVALVALATAYMAADLPERPPHREPPLAGADPRMAARASARRGQDDRRGKVRHLFAWLNAVPLLLASLLFSATAPWVATHLGPPIWNDWLAFALGFGLMHWTAAKAGSAWRLQRGLHPRLDRPLRDMPWTISVGAFGGALLLAALWLLGKGWPQTGAQGLPVADALGDREWFALLATPAMVGVFWSTVTAFAVVTRVTKSEFDREWWARAAGWWLVCALVWLAAGLLVLVLPRMVLDLLQAQDGVATAGGVAVTGGGAALVGVLSSVWGYWSRNSQKLVAGTKGMLATLNARALDAAAAAFIVLLGLTLALGTSLLLERLASWPQVAPANAATAAVGAGGPADAAGRVAPAASAARQPKLPMPELLLAERLDAQRLAALCAPRAVAMKTLRIEGQVVATLADESPAAADARRSARCPAPAPSAAEHYRAVLHALPLALLLQVAAVLTAVGLVINARAGTNVFSLHGLYGNRLIRAYLGASVREHDQPHPHAAADGIGVAPVLARRPHRFTGFDEADNMPLARLAGQQPFLVVNAALNLTQASGDRLEWQQRKAASFTFTPLACGSLVLGHAPTVHYGRRHPVAEPAADPADGSLSVGRAMAISGAAASPNMGYHSSPVVAFAMSFFNVRLGWWLPNPKADMGHEPSLPAAAAVDLKASAEARAASRAERRKHWGRDEPPWNPQMLLAETLGRSNEHSDFVYLSDGGHFDNLGLYEMVRRRCHRIVVVDATGDPQFRHEDLQATLRKIRIDLGVVIEFPHGVPDAESCRRLGRPWSLATVRYDTIDPGAPDGSLLYIKPALWRGLPLDVQHYADRSKGRRRPEFPHQSTGDQFFDEAQFESYRLLGLLATTNALPDARWPTGRGPDHRAAPGAAPAPTGAGQAGAPAARR